MWTVALLCVASVGQYRHCSTAQTYRAYAPSYSYGYQQYQYQAPTYYAPNYVTFAPVKEDPYEAELIAARARAKLRAGERARGEADLAGQLGRLSETVARLDLTVGRGAAALAQPVPQPAAVATADPVVALPAPDKAQPYAQPQPYAYPPPAPPGKGYPPGYLAPNALPVPNQPAKSPYVGPPPNALPAPAGDAAPPPPVRSDVPPPAPVPAPPGAAALMPEKVKILLTERCSKCHSGATAKGNPPVRLFEDDGSPATLSPATLLRIDMATYAGTMPPGKPLEEADYSDLRAFVDSNRASIAAYLKQSVTPQ